MTQPNPVSTTGDESLLRMPEWIHRTAFLDRACNSITKCYPGEGLSAVLMAFYIFLLLAIFTMLKAVREALILQEGGAALRSYATAIQAGALLLAVPIYGWVASKFERVKLIFLVSSFYLVHLLLFVSFLGMGRNVGAAFYVWLGTFNVMIIAQFWSFATDLYSEEQGKRLFPVIGVGSTVGALGGAKLGEFLFSRMGTEAVLVASAALLGLTLLIVWLVDKFVCACGGPQAIISALPVGKDGGFKLLRADRYLLVVAFLSLTFNLVTSGKDFLFASLIKESALANGAISATDQRSYIGQFFSNYLLWSSLLGFLLQISVVGRIMDRIGVAKSLLILPMFSLVDGVAMLLTKSMAILFPLKVIHAALEFSLYSTAANSLLLGMSRPVKYKVKSAIDTFFWRTGDLANAILVRAGTQIGLDFGHYAAAGLAGILAWIGVGAWLVKESQVRDQQRPEWSPIPLEEAGPL
jgi:ATP:ADP antiporter, AAA family